jgi:phage shock protein PspC (stress-responsive transcriptional regulator)
METNLPYTPLRRSRDDRMLAGVCGGLGRYFDVNPAYYRVAFVVLALLGGAGILIYLAAVLVLPDEGETDSIAAQILRDHRRQPWALIALGILAIAALALLSHATLWPHGDAAWLLLLAAAAFIFFTRRPGKGYRRVLRGLVITFSVLVALALVAAAVVASISGVHLGRGIGDRTYNPASVAEVRHDYKLGVGSLRLDLSNVRFPAGTTKLDVDAGIGDVSVTVPAGVTVVADASARLGSVDVFDRTDDGQHASVKTTDAAGNTTHRLLIHAHVGTGQVEIRRP